MTVNLKPSHDDVKRFGILAHVSVEERKRIMALSTIGEHGEFEREKASIERALKEARKQEKKVRR